MAESKIKDENYFQIQGFMLNRLKLKGILLEVYAIIYGFSQDGESCFTGSLQYLCDFTNTSKPTVIKALKDLVEKGYLIKQENEINGVKFNKYKADLTVVKKLNGGSKETLLGGSKETLPNNKGLDNELNNNILNIVNYLNLRTGSKFKPNNKTTVKHITARLKEGYTIDDFKTVIDKKCADWLKDAKMCEYLRPSTLFAGKFEEYLNCNKKRAEQKPAEETETFKTEVFKL